MNGMTGWQQNPVTIISHTMRDIYPRQLSHKALTADRFDGSSATDADAPLTTTNRAPTNARSLRRPSMSNSMAFFRGGSISTSISSLLSSSSESENAVPDRLAEADQNRSTRTATSTSASLPSFLHRSFSSMMNSMFQCKSDEKDLVASNHIMRTMPSTKEVHVASTSLADRDRSEGDEAKDGDIQNSKDQHQKDTPGIAEILQSQSSSSSSKVCLDISCHSSANRCPLCLQGMSPADLAHPPQCGTPKCSFNFCLDCAEAYITSSKDPYQMASDGSLQLKIFLRCPSCRSDLSTSIRDTVLLRHADIANNLDDDDNDNDEIKLTPSDISFRDAMSDPFIQTAVAAAKEREIQFLLDDGLQADSLSAKPWASTPPSSSNNDNKTTRRHSFFYGLIEDAKKAREKKKKMLNNRHSRGHSTA